MAVPTTITDAVPLLRGGEFTPVDLLEACFARIDRYESQVHAWAYLDRDRAMGEALRLTAELQRGEDRGPLHGIPVGIKDIIDVFDMPTGCGSRLWVNSYARRDATCVARLRHAGAIILGKTVTTPYAFLDPPPTRNPWNLSRTPGGSSSGSAAAVACGMCFAALGTQTGGSITRPASFCGVASLKPTHGSVNVEGVLPLAPSLDHVGVMAHSVRDLAIMNDVIAGPDGNRGAMLAVPSPESSPNLYRFGGMFDDKLSESAQPHYDATLNGLERNGTGLRQVLPPAEFSQVLKWQRTIMAVEAAQYHQDRFQRRPDEYPLRIRELIEEGLATPAVVYAEILDQKTALSEDVTRLLNGRHFILTPSALGPAPDAATTGDASFNAPWSFTGHPTVSVPYGWSEDGLPLALQLVGTPGREDGLLQVAAWCETALAFPRRELPLP